MRKELLLSLLLFAGACEAVFDPFSWGVAATVGGAALAGIYAGVASLKCRWTECCISDWIKPDINGLDNALRTKLHGQHLVQEVVMKVLRRHLSRQNPTKALVLAFHGWTGSGKNFVSSLIAQHLFEKGMSSSFVHLFIGTRHFLHADKSGIYKENLQSWIQGNISNCEQSLFIFDEVDKMPPGVIEAIVPFVDFHPLVDGQNFRRAIFILLSNTGGTDINRLSLQFWHDGKKRESIGMEDIETLIHPGAFNEDGGLKQSYMLKKHLVDHYVPFLPLERKHIRKCIEDEIATRKVSLSGRAMASTIDAVDRQVLYGPPESKLYSATGCKKIPAILDRVLED